MTWVRIESGFFRHRKVIDLPIAAKLLFLGGLCYAAENSTDGHISRSALRVLAAELDVKPVTTTLEYAGLWHKQADGWDIHDYLVYQPSAEAERQRRQEHADRMKTWRDQRKRRPDSGVRDGNRGGSRDASQPESQSESQPLSRDASRTTSVTLSPNPNPNPVVTSSSSEPLSRAPAGEEEDPWTTEARRRYAARVGEAVTNPEAWVQAARQRLVEEGWQPAPATAKAPPVLCSTCKDVALVDGCDDCGKGLG